MIQVNINIKASASNYSMNKRSSFRHSLLWVTVLMLIVISAQSAPANPDCVRWGQTFDVPLDFSLVPLNCKLPYGQSVCCAAVDDPNDPTNLESFLSHGVGHEYVPLAKDDSSLESKMAEILSVVTGDLSKCKMIKEYVPSNHEIRDLEVTVRLRSIENFDERFTALMDYVTSQDYIKNSTIWLQRLSNHMSSSYDAPATIDDFEYLSRFEYSLRCPNAIVDSIALRKISAKYDSNFARIVNQRSPHNDLPTDDSSIVRLPVLIREWIEPLTITARHPFSFGRCRGTGEYYRNKMAQIKSEARLGGGLPVKIPRHPRSDVDYVLLQGGSNLHNLSRILEITKLERTHIDLNNDFYGQVTNPTVISSRRESTKRSFYQAISDTLTSITSIPVTDYNANYDKETQSSSTTTSATSATTSLRTSTSSSEVSDSVKIRVQKKKSVLDKYQTSQIVQTTQLTSLSTNSESSTTSAINSQRFFVDCGTSTFPSSLLWFTCAYSQRGVSFDGVYGFEYTLLEPIKYWSMVPQKWLPFWHFYNAPVTATTSELYYRGPQSRRLLNDEATMGNDTKNHRRLDENNANLNYNPLGNKNQHHPLRYLQQLASSKAFLAWKLDIDTPEVEMPLALQLLNGEDQHGREGTVMASMVDEFFFELHFRCEVMTRCGWGQRVPETSHGLVLERTHILLFFAQLRRMGIRAHVWP